MQALKQHGVEKFTSLGEKFDPNMHSALFEMPDPSKEPGTVGAVSKVHFKMVPVGFQPDGLFAVCTQLLSLT